MTQQERSFKMFVDQRRKKKLEEATHWHVLSGDAHGSLMGHGMVLVEPAGLPAGSFGVPCSETLCFTVQVVAATLGQVNATLTALLQVYQQVNAKPLPFDLGGLRRS